MTLRIFYAIRLLLIVTLDKEFLFLSIFQLKRWKLCCLPWHWHSKNESWQIPSQWEGLCQVNGQHDQGKCTNNCLPHFAFLKCATGSFKVVEVNSITLFFDQVGIFSLNSKKCASLVLEAARGYTKVVKSQKNLLLYCV